MSHDAQLWVRSRSPLAGGEYAVHLTMALTVDQHSIVFMDQSWLAEQSRVSRSTVTRAVARMLALGLLERVDTPEQETARKACHRPVRLRMVFPELRPIVSTGHGDAANQDESEVSGGHGDASGSGSTSHHDAATPNSMRHHDAAKEGELEKQVKQDSHAQIDVPASGPVADAPLRGSLFEPPDPTPHRTAAEIFREEQTEAAWQEFWKVFPRHKAPEAARAEFIKATKRVDSRVLIEKAKEYADTVRSENRIAKFICQPKNWLKDKRWLDDRDETPEEQLLRELSQATPINGNGQRDLY